MKKPALICIGRMKQYCIPKNIKPSKYILTLTLDFETNGFIALKQYYNRNGDAPNGESPLTIKYLNVFTMMVYLF